LEAEEPSEAVRVVEAEADSVEAEIAEVASADLVEEASADEGSKSI
jgi:hypothetical protein